MQSALNANIGFKGVKLNDLPLSCLYKYNKNHCRHVHLNLELTNGASLHRRTKIWIYAKQANGKTEFRFHFPEDQEHTSKTIISKRGLINTLNQFSPDTSKCEELKQVTEAEHAVPFFKNDIIQQLKAKMFMLRKFEEHSKRPEESNVVMTFDKQPTREWFFS